MNKRNLWMLAAILCCGLMTNVDGWYDAFGITGGALYRKPAERIKIW